MGIAIEDAVSILPHWHERRIGRPEMPRHSNQPEIVERLRKDLQRPPDLSSSPRTAGLSKEVRWIDHEWRPTLIFDVKHQRAADHELAIGKDLASRYRDARSLPMASS